MVMNTTYPKIRTVYLDVDDAAWIRCHPYVTLIEDEADDHAERANKPRTLFCGYSWCDGSCGATALVIAEGDKQLKCYSSMVACGAVWQPFRQPWLGLTTPLLGTYILLLRERYWV